MFLSENDNAGGDVPEGLSLHKGIEVFTRRWPKAKPITYFGNYTLPDAKMAYVPIHVGMDTLPAESEYSLWFDDTKLHINTAEVGAGTTIASGACCPASVTK